MKANITVTELTHEDIVNILSSGLYDCNFLDVTYSKKIWNTIPADKREGDCYEDHLADMLLNDYSIQIIDIYADGLLYTRRQHSPKPYINMDDEGVYALRLQDLLWACNTMRGYRYLTEILSGEGDYHTANSLIQIAVFGEEIYSD